MPSEPMIAAAARFKNAWTLMNWHRAEDVAVSVPLLIEMHEATLGLIEATGARDLDGAVGVLHDIDAG